MAADDRNPDGFPGASLRGLRSPKYGVAGRVDTKAFEPDPKTRRADGMIELSVDWEDDDSTVERLRKSQSAQGGVARLDRMILDGFIALLGTDAHPLPGGSVAYERQPIEGNDSHGNILFDAELPRSSQKQIAAWLASAAFLI